MVLPSGLPGRALCARVRGGSLYQRPHAFERHPCMVPERFMEAGVQALLVGIFAPVAPDAVRNLVQHYGGGEARRPSIHLLLNA